MRILAGPWLGLSAEYMLPALRAQPDVDLVVMAQSGHPELNPDVEYDLSEGFEAILERLPGGFEPDFLLYWMPQSRPLPSGIERCPFPVVACIGDWNHSFHGLRDISRAFDFILTDRKGVDVFRRAGCERVEHALLYGFDPATHHRIPGIAKTCDVGIVGTVGSAVHPARARLLGRLASSGRHKVSIQTDLYGEDYARAVNQARLTFDYSIRGEMNMRAYEAAACGSLLLLEDDNLEVRDVFEDRVHCVLYNEGNLDDLVDYYVSHDAERERMMEAAYERVQGYTYERQFARLLGRIQQLDVAKQDRSRRAFFDLGPAGRGRARAAHLTQCLTTAVTDGAPLAALQELQGEVTAEANPIALTNVGFVCAYFDSGAAAQNAALHSFDAALQVCPDHVLGWTNLAEVRWATGDVHRAGKAFEMGLAVVDDTPAELFSECFPLPSVRGIFRFEFERVSTEFVDDREGYTAAMRSLYRWYLWDRIGDVRLRQESWEEAAGAFRSAVAEKPFPPTRFKLAKALARLKQIDAAVREARVVVEEDPFNFEARGLLAQGLLQFSGTEAWRRECADALRIVQACPKFASLATAFEAQLSEAHAVASVT